MTGGIEAIFFAFVKYPACISFQQGQIEESNNVLSRYFFLTDVIFASGIKIIHFGLTHIH